MKFKLKMLSLLIFAMGLQTTQAQVKLPAPSSGQTLIQDFGLGKITLIYSRPNTKGRKIFGALEPYDKVWRTGANANTIIKFSDDITLQGVNVPAGEYSLFTIPNKTQWTVILSKNAKQWGAYTYDAKDDVVRFNVKPMKLKDKLETFTMQFANVFPTSAQLQIIWENTLLSIDLTTSIDEKVMASIDAAMKGDKKPYFQSAQYYLENGKDLNTALNWINEAEKADGKAPYIKLWKAKIQLKMGDSEGAQATALAGMNLATEQKNDEYIRLNAQVLADAKNVAKTPAKGATVTRKVTYTTTEIRKN